MRKIYTWIGLYPYPLLHIMFYFNLIVILKVKDYDLPSRDENHMLREEK